MRWEREGPALYRLTVVVQRDGAPTEAIVDVNGENRSITGVSTYELAQGSYAVTVYCEDRVQTRQVELFSDRSIGFNFRALDDPREDRLLIAGVPLMIAVALALLVLFMKRGGHGEMRKDRRSASHSDTPLDGPSLLFGRHCN